MSSKVQVASTIALTFLLLVLISPSVYAQCGGLCLYEVGHPLQGASSAGAGAAAQDASTTFFNPAGMTLVSLTDRLRLGFAFKGLYGGSVNYEDDWGRPHLGDRFLADRPQYRTNGGVPPHRLALAWRRSEYRVCHF